MSLLNIGLEFKDVIGCLVIRVETDLSFRFEMTTLQIIRKPLMQNCGVKFGESMSHHLDVVVEERL
jgi:hypothetical protein